MQDRIRVLMSKPGIDGHWRGIVVVSRGLRDAGMEVIFGGFQTVEEIAETASQEDVQVVGLSIHSGAHFIYTKKVLAELEQRGIKDDITLIVGGPIPLKDVEKLKEMGVAAVFRPGSAVEEMAEFIKNAVKF